MSPSPLGTSVGSESAMWAMTNKSIVIFIGLSNKKNGCSVLETLVKWCHKEVLKMNDCKIHHTP